jgi:LemA protein
MHRERLCNPKQQPSERKQKRIGLPEQIGDWSSTMRGATMAMNQSVGGGLLARLLVSMFACLLLAGCGINNIPTYEEAAKARWSEVLNQYQRRADLIPNLVETVKGFAAQEKDVLTSVVEARAKATSTQLPPDLLTNPEAFKAFQENQTAITSSLSRLLAVVEAYPDLKSNQNFLALQSQLEGTENRIAVARRDYIAAVQAFNTEIRTIPGRWWRSLMYPEAKEMQTFTIEAEKMETPKVEFNKTGG